MADARRLVVCCDGTWNTASDATNVKRFHDLLAATDDQVPRYFDGLGTGGGPIRRLLGGALGLGLAEHVQEAYAWLAKTYAPGDRLVLVGFSRGAYTVRSLAAMLARCGLVRFAPDASPADKARTVDRVYRDGYRAGRDPRAWGLDFHPAFGPDDPAPLAFLGVWDTIGSLGVPATFGVLSRLLGRDDHRFHDLALPRDVRHARQAVALDERRGPYVPSLWRPPEPGVHDSFAQVWFPGAHGDVGGGKPGTDLSDGALRWMIEEADGAVGLRFDGDVDAVVGDPCGVAEDSLDGLWRYLSPRPRSAPHVVPANPEVHASAVARRACGLVPPYRPGAVPAVGEQRDVAVPASQPWFETGLYLPTGRYHLAVRGTWFDHGAAAPGTGVRRWPLRSWPAYGLGTLLGGLRRLIRRVTGNPRAAVVGARRIAAGRWMELVAAVANDVLELDGTVREGTTAPIGPDGRREMGVNRAGYLYAFADDAWTGYGSNHGAVTLSVTCLARADEPRARTSAG